MPNTEFPPGNTVVSRQQLPHRSQLFVTVGTMYFGYAMFMVLRMVPTVAGQAMREDPALNIDLAVLGRIFAMGTFGAMIGKFIGGYAADKFGGKLTFTVGLLISSVFVGLFSTSSAVWMFELTYFFALMAKSFGWPSMAKIISNWFRPDEYGRVWGILSTSSRVGTLVATLCLVNLLVFMSWRVMLVITAAAGVLTVVYFAIVLKERPKGQVVVTSDDPEDSKTPPHPLDNTTLPEALVRFARSPQFWLITGSLMGLTILMDFLLMVPMYLRDTLQLSIAQASMAASAFPFGSMISVLAGGYVFDKLSRNSTTWVIGVLLTLATGCLATFVLMPQFGMTSASLAYLSLALLFLFGLCVSPCYYIPMSVFSLEFGGPHSGFLISLLDAIAFGATAIFYFYAGAIAEESWNLFLSVLLAISAWSLLTSVFFMRGESLYQKA
jgi:OPA family sugar phosphate sensor protein UhpC-like MFS transporter